MKSRKFRCPDTKNTLISIQTPKPGIFRPPTKTKPIPIHSLRSSQVGSPTLKSRQLRPPTQRPSDIRPPTQKSPNFDAPLKSSQFRFPLSIQLNFDASTQSPSWFRYRHYNQVLFDPHTNPKAIPMFALKSSQVRLTTLKSSHFRPPTRKPSLSVNYTKIKLISASTQSISTPRTKTESTSIQTLKRRQSRSPTQTIEWILSPPLK